MRTANLRTTRKIVYAGLLVVGMLFGVTAAQASPVTYVLSTPGVV